jgi:hypothetical protein
MSPLMSSVLREMRSRLAQAKASSLEFLQSNTCRAATLGAALVARNQTGWVPHDGPARRRVRLLTKNGYNWSARYTGIVAATMGLTPDACRKGGPSSRKKKAPVGTVRRICCFITQRGERHDNTNFDTARHRQRRCAPIADRDCGARPIHLEFC